MDTTVSLNIYLAPSLSLLAELARFMRTLGSPKTQFENNLGSKTTLQMSMMVVLVMMVMVLVTVLVVLVEVVVVYESST